jgi:hypothetical protein
VSAAPEAGGARRRFWWAGAAGTVPAAALFTWLLTIGTWDLFAWRQRANYYDAQAHSLLDGRLDMPKSVLGIEAFASRGRQYMYQGPFPALLRLPVAAFTRSLDGRLAALSMVVAFVVTAAAVIAVAWHVRRAVRGESPVGRWEAVAVAGFVFACLGGSLPLALASQVSVYHESAMWGLATGLAGLAVVLRHVSSPSRWTLPVASVLAAASLCSRASIGLGVVAAIGMVGLGEAAAWWRARRGAGAGALTECLRPRRPATSRAVATALLAASLPVLLYVAINVAKFGTLASVPWEKQTFYILSGDRQDFLRINGSFFGARFAPSTLLEYLRPNAFALDGRFPWIGFRLDAIGRRTLLRGVVFDRVDATGSVPVSFPLLTVLGGVAVVACSRARRAARPSHLVPSLAGAAVAAASMFGFGYIALRYLADVTPLLVLVGAVGFGVVLGPVVRPVRGWRSAAVVCLVAVGVLGTWVNLGQGIWYQRVFASPSDEDVTRGFLERRQSLGVLGAGRVLPVGTGPHLPYQGKAADLFVVGDCDGLYVSDGAGVDNLSHTNWKPVVRTAGVGAHVLDVRFDDAPAGTVEPLLVSGTRQEPNVLAVLHLGGGRIRFRYEGLGYGAGVSVQVRTDRWYRVRAVLDPETDFSLVTVDGRVVFSGTYDAEALPSVGRNDLDASTRPTFGGALRSQDDSRDLCRSILRSR